MESVSVVIPVFNEEQNLPELVERTRAACLQTGLRCEIILIDDGSKDRSVELIQKAAEEPSEEKVSVVGIILNRNYGQHAAVMAGFSHSQGAAVITLDADLQNPPEEIPRLVRELNAGFDVVGTLRVCRRDSFFRRVASSLINWVAQRATGVKMHDYGCMLRGYSRQVIDAMLQCQEHSTFIPILANSFARRTTEIEVGHAQRTEGESKYSLWKLINLQFDLLTGMTTFPLRVLSVVGVAVSALGFFFGSMLMLMRLLYGSVWAAQGVFTLFAALFIFIGGQFIGMGLLGEYIGRIYHDVRARPRYFVERRHGRGLQAQLIPGERSVSGAAAGVVLRGH